MVINELTIESIELLMQKVLDPEVPALNIVDLGVFRKVEFVNNQFEIYITPTYTGCPAMNTIEMDIRNLLIENGVKNFKIHTILSPAWTTDWMSEEARKKLLNYGIAPPGQSTEEHLKSLATGVSRPVVCPFCESDNTKLTSPFGSTACKALHYCNGCHQPFEEFKCH